MADPQFDRANGSVGAGSNPSHHDTPIDSQPSGQPTVVRADVRSVVPPLESRGHVTTPLTDATLWTRSLLEIHPRHVIIGGLSLVDPQVLTVPTLSTQGAV